MAALMMRSRQRNVLQRTGQGALRVDGRSQHREERQKLSCNPDHSIRLYVYYRLPRHDAGSLVIVRKPVVNEARARATRAADGSTFSTARQSSDYGSRGSGACNDLNRMCF